MPKVSWSKPLWDPIPRAVQRHVHAEAQAQQYNDPRWNWVRRHHVRRALIVAYLVTLAALATVGWIDALRSGQREGLTGILWLAFFVAILVEQALLDKATRGLFGVQQGAGLLESPAAPAWSPHRSPSAGEYALQKGHPDLRQGRQMLRQGGWGSERQRRGGRRHPGSTDREGVVGLR
jgi:hypothetical protein